MKIVTINHQEKEEKLIEIGIALIMSTVIKFNDYHGAWLERMANEMK